MFWKKDAPPAPAPAATSPSQRSPSQGESARPSDAKDLDTAIDSVVALLRAFGEHAFDTDNVTAEDTRSECDGWARKISMGERLGVEGGPLKRDFGGARRYFAAHRAHE